MKKLILALFIVLGAVFATKAQDEVKFKVDRYQIYVDGTPTEGGNISKGIVTISPDKATFDIRELSVHRTVNLGSSETTRDQGIKHISFLASDEDVIVMFSITDDGRQIIITYITPTFYILFNVSDHSLNYRGI